MQTEEKLLSLVLNFASCAFLFAGMFLWLRRKSGDRARTYLAAVLLFSGICFLIRLFGTYTGVPFSASVLPIQNLIGGSLVMIPFYAYPIEVMNPGWFSVRRVAILCLPCIAIFAVLLILPMEFRELSSFAEIFQYASEPNVWFRLLMLLLIQLYVILVFIIPRNWKKSSVSNHWVRFYSFLIFCMGILYGLFVLTGSPIISILHLLFCFAFCILITYQELFTRMRVPASHQPMPTVVTSMARMNVMEVLPTEEENAHPLWVELNRLMKEEELWRNPDTTQDSMASLLNVSRPTLASVIRENGFSGYKEYLNRCRIEEFLKIINSNPKVSVQEAFFYVGYRSRQTALQYFGEYMGCSPAEYLNQRSNSEQK